MNLHDDVSTTTHQTTPMTLHVITRLHTDDIAASNYETITLQVMTRLHTNDIAASNY